MTATDDSETTSSEPFDQAWDLTAAEFEKANARLTPEVLKDKDAIREVFVDLLRSSLDIAHRFIADQKEMEIYNALYEDMVWNGCEEDEAICELVNETAYEAEDYV
jgi:hypothetical protein